MCAIFGYFVYNRYSSYKKFENIQLNLGKMKAWEFDTMGPLLIEAPVMKFNQKFLSRDDYHKWIENDIRTFGSSH